MLVFGEGVLEALGDVSVAGISIHRLALQLAP